MNPFFSIIIPLYNKEKFVVNTLHSVLAQTFENYEVIIVEDCSTDTSYEVVASFQSEKIHIVKHEVNKGLSAARNTGIRNAKSDYIAFLDADDVWKKEYLAELHVLIGNFPQAKLLATNYEEFYPKNVVLLPENNSEKLKKQGLIDDFFAISLAQPLYCPSSLCVQKSVFERIGFYDETIQFGEDVDFNIRANSNFLLAYSTKPLVRYYMTSENQITHSPLGTKTITNFDAFDHKETSKSLKKFLDFHRYIMAKHYKVQGNYEQYNKMKGGIDAKNLNFKQRFLLTLPSFLLRWIKRIKAVSLNSGMRFTTYD